MSLSKCTSNVLQFRITCVNPTEVFKRKKLKKETQNEPILSTQRNRKHFWMQQSSISALLIYVNLSWSCVWVMYSWAGYAINSWQHFRTQGMDNERSVKVTYLRCWGQSAASRAVSSSSSPLGCHRDQPCPCGWLETWTAGCLDSYLALSPGEKKKKKWYKGKKGAKGTLFFKNGILTITITLPKYLDVPAEGSSCSTQLLPLITGTRRRKEDVTRPTINCIP